MGTNEHGWCDNPQCAKAHVRAVLEAPKWRTKDSDDRVCPSCSDATVSLNPTGSRKVHLMGHCHRDPARGGPCPDADIRAALSVKYHVPDECLGKFGLKGRTVSSGTAPRQRASGADKSAAARWWAVRKLPRWLSRDFRLMCEQAIADWPDDFPPSDPCALLGLDYDVFIALAKRAEIDATYRSKLWKVWSNHECWERDAG